MRLCLTAIGLVPSFGVAHSTIDCGRIKTINGKKKVTSFVKRH